MATSIAELEAVITADTSGFDAGVAGADAKLKSLDGTAKSTGANFGVASAAMAAGAVGIGAGLLDAINSAADFQFQMDAVAAATGATGEQFAALEEQALSLGASSKFSAGEVANVQEALGKAGIDTTKLLDGATDAVLDMSAATGEDLVTSAESAAAAINLFGLEGDQITGVADTFTAGLNKSSASLSDFQTGMNNLGPTMANLARYADDPEKAFTDTAAAVAYFNSQGLKAADAGISLARGMTNLADPTSDASALMAELGISAFDAQGNFLPLPDLMDQLQVGMGGMSDSAREAALATIFGAEAADVMNIAIKNGGDGLREYEADMVSAGQAAEQAAIRQENFAGVMESLQGSIEGAKIAFGLAFLPVLTEVALKLTDLVNVFTSLPEPIQHTIAFVAAGAAAFLAVGSAIGFIIGPLGAFVGAIGPVAAGIVAIAAPLALVVAGLAALYVAYQTNFLGFADGVNAVAGAVMTTFSNIASAISEFVSGFTMGFQNAIDAGMNPFSAALQGVATGLAFIGGDNTPAWLADLAVKFRDAAGVVGELATAFQTWRSLGLDPVHAALAALSTVFPQVSGAVQVAIALWENFTTTLAGIAAGFQEVVAAIQAGDLGGVLTGVFHIAEAAVTGFIGNLAILGQAFLDAFNAIDWGAVAAAIAAGLAAVGSAIATWLQEQSTNLLTGFQTAWDAIAAQIPGAWSVIQAAIGAAWAVIQETVSAALIAIQQIVTDAWIAVETAIAGPLETAKATVLAAWTAIQETVALAMQTVIETVSTTWTAIQDTIATAQETIASAITTAWLAINEFVGTAVQTILSTVQTAFDAITTAITTAATEAKDGFLSTLSTMKDEAIATLTGIKDGIVALFADAGTWLLDAGAAIVQGLIDGLASMMGPLNDAVGGITSLVSDAANAAGGVIEGGRDLVDTVTGGGGGEPSGGGGGGPSRRRAMGGPVSAGLAYWVGEGGAELFVPQSSGRVLSHQDSMAAAGGGGTVAYQTNIAQVVVRDDRHLQRWARDEQRRSERQRSRGR